MSMSTTNTTNTNTIEPRPCKSCGEMFEPRKGRIRYCSLACLHAVKHEPSPSEIAEKAREIKHANEDGHWTDSLD